MKKQINWGAVLAIAYMVLIWTLIIITPLLGIATLILVPVIGILIFLAKEKYNGKKTNKI